MTETRALSLLDWVSTVMDRPDRPLDFCIIIELDPAVTMEALRAGADAARRTYPTSAARLRGRRWILPSPDDAAGSSFESTLATADSWREEVEGWCAQAMKLNVDPPLQQRCFVQPSGEIVLATRFHHALCDGIGALLWLGHQLAIAAKAAVPATPDSRRKKLKLRSPAEQRRRDLLAKPRPCQPLCARGRRRSPRRGWIAFSIDSAPVPPRRWLDKPTTGQRFTAALLETLYRWNRHHGGEAAAQRVGLWTPVNIRTCREEGFGNGTSRIRLYRPWREDDPPAAWCASVRHQIETAWETGEWAVPARPAPGPVLGALARAYFNRPWVDMGTAVGTYLPGWPQGDPAVLSAVRDIQIVGSLARQHALGLVATRLHDAIGCTLTYDPAMLQRPEAAAFIDQFREAWKHVRA